MLRPSKKMLFAIEAVLDIAYHAGGEPVQSREITRRQGIPRRYLEQTLQQLVRAGVLDKAAVDRIKDAIAKDISLSRPRSVSRDEYMGLVRSRLDGLFDAKDQTQAAASK